MKKTVVLDFDGVLHAYTTPWKNARTISDGPVPYAMIFLFQCMHRFDVCILSSRSHQWGGRRAMKKWLRTWITREISDTVATMQQVIVADLIREEWDDAAPYETNVRDIAEIILSRIRFPLFKPPAHLTLDDRALRFEGRFPDPKFIEDFKPWNKK